MMHRQTHHAATSVGFREERQPIRTVLVEELQRRLLLEASCWRLLYSRGELQNCLQRDIVTVTSCSKHTIHSYMIKMLSK